MNRWILRSISVVTVMTLAACGASRTAGWDRDMDRQQGDLTEVLADAEQAWLDRGNKESLEKAIALYEKAIAINPDQLDVLIRLARANYFLSDGYYRGNEEAQLKYYDEAASWGERAMAQSSEFVKLVRENGEAVEDAIRVLGEEHVGAVYWSASAVGKWARLKGFTTILSQKNKIKKFMEWATKTDEDYFYGGPHRYWGAYYAIAPSFAGGDVEKSRQSFEKSLEMEPNYLGTKVLMADVYATKIQDEELYRKLLTEVIEADPTVIPAIVPEQKVEQEKARELIKLVEDRFAGMPSTRTLALRLPY